MQFVIIARDRTDDGAVARRSGVRPDARLTVDPYVTGGVWKEIEVHPYRAAVGSWLPA